MPDSILDLIMLDCEDRVGKLEMKKLRHEAFLKFFDDRNDKRYVTEYPIYESAYIIYKIYVQDQYEKVDGKFVRKDRNPILDFDDEGRGKE